MWWSYTVMRLKARVLAWTVFLALLWFKPRSLLPVIDYGTSFVAWLMQQAIKYAPKPVDYMASKVIAFINWVTSWVQVVVVHYVEEPYKDVARVLLKLVEPGGFLLIAWFAIGARVILMMWQLIKERLHLRKWRKGERKEPHFGNLEFPRKQEPRAPEPPPAPPPADHPAHERTPEWDKFYESLKDIRKDIKPRHDE